MAAEALRLAVVGDVHGFWDEADSRYFNQAAYAAVLFTGDLAPLIGSLPTARGLADLRVPAYLIPGNHDATGALQFLAELRGHERLAALLGVGQRFRVAALRRALGTVKLVGYSLEELNWNGRPLGLIAARPFSMGGDRLHFRAYLQRRYGVRSVDDSAARLCTLVDAAPDDLLFLAHNGPSGLGAERGDIWGCDFRAAGGDFGDPDLRVAVEHARQRGKTVHAVIAGHMHHGLKGGGKRAWLKQRDGILYVNAARVPRIRERDGRQLRHHVVLTLDGRGARAAAVWIDAGGAEKDFA
jgi:uncharacterized protein (TIGR04168 family)